VKTTEIKEKATDELENLAQDLTRKLWKARFENHSNQLDDTSSIPKLRRDIARVKTILTERRIGATE
jgi:large subunit ribosomal protein L29